ncbi:MAG: shikimate dehydrogenase [Formosimonas sp.]
MKKFAVIGNPIAHSRSPEIHAAFARQCGIELSYERVLCDLDGFAACVADLRARGLSGANVTVPFKLDAFAGADELSAAAQWAGAVNTLILNDKTHGDNTDGVGLVQDITVNWRTPLAGKRVLLLGAGGAARGVLRPILLAQPASVTVKNRSLDKAQVWLAQVQTTADFAAVLGDSTLNVAAWADAAAQDYDVVINATASGLGDGFVAPSSVRWAADALAYDMMYGKPTEFLAWAREHGARIADGWGMLVEQAAASFKIWHGVAPDTSALIASKGQ